MRVQQSIAISAPPGRVWPFFIEPEKVLQWCITFRRFEYTGERRSGVGAPIYLEEKAAGPLMKMSFQVTDWAENQRIAMKMTSGGPLKSYEQRWTLAPSESGSVFTFVEEIRMPFGVLGRLIEKIGRGRSEAAVREMLGKLRSLAEA